MFSYPIDEIQAGLEMKDIENVLEQFGASVTRGLSAEGSVSREKLCQAYDLSLRTLDRIESGDPNVSISNYLIVAKALGFSSLFQTLRSL